MCKDKFSLDMTQTLHLLRNCGNLVIWNANGQSQESSCIEIQTIPWEIVHLATYCINNVFILPIIFAIIHFKMEFKIFLLQCSYVSTPFSLKAWWFVVTSLVPSLAWRVTVKVIFLLGQQLLATVSRSSLHCATIIIINKFSIYIATSSSLTHSHEILHIYDNPSFL